mmetsp:Transcript_3224/g.5063  ORF Transcript_3224/g.5063 Transcript_3224/m.5063 type:complete len:328 (-) Transcript_3224:384-1367(-)|eukprot:CAMPEP_0196821964 /NCGR_PEP_ID=MMETSP1362-20130617/81688_1 /TAXON_ID=163516 /ORGANISM="Leptocylindrus danicus, Strain CCMP1856" /LENGTH=327 /DNA_ID=CAMNT_0042201361 /DNA_START=150 /DNA_END=1133 /DNA_ORIENTATION=+
MVCMSALEQSSVNMDMEKAPTVGTATSETPTLVISKTTSKQTLMDADEKKIQASTAKSSHRSMLSSKDETVIIVSDSEDSLSGISEKEDDSAEEFEEVSVSSAEERVEPSVATSAGGPEHDDEYLMSTSNHSRIIKKTRSLPDFPTLLGGSNHESPKISVPKSVKVSRSQSETASENHQVAHLGARRSVTFGVVNIREYDLTLGDHPDCTFGPPMSLDWDYEEVFESSVEYYETNREPRRKPHQMIQNYFRRKNILMACAGFSEKDLKKATREVERAKFKRNLTKTFLPAWKFEDVLESAARKTKRAVTRKNKRSSTKKSVQCQADV